MGQQIVVERPVVEGDTAIFTTDRNLTGMGAATFASSGDVKDEGHAAARVAAHLYEVDPELGELYIAGNVVVARRPGGWDEAHLTALSRAIETAFLFYPPQPADAAAVS